MTKLLLRELQLHQIDLLAVEHFAFVVQRLLIALLLQLEHLLVIVIQFLVQLALFKYFRKLKFCFNLPFRARQCDGHRALDWELLVRFSFCPSLHAQSVSSVEFRSCRRDAAGRRDRDCPGTVRGWFRWWPHSRRKRLLRRAVFRLFWRVTDELRSSVLWEEEFKWVFISTV